MAEVAGNRKQTAWRVGKAGRKMCVLRPVPGVGLLCGSTEVSTDMPGPCRLAGTPESEPWVAWGCGTQVHTVWGIQGPALGRQRRKTAFP